MEFIDIQDYKNACLIRLKLLLTPVFRLQFKYLTVLDVVRIIEMSSNSEAYYIILNFEANNISLSICINTQYRSKHEFYNCNSFKTTALPSKFRFLPFGLSGSQRTFFNFISPIIWYHFHEHCLIITIKVWWKLESTNFNTLWNGIDLFNLRYIT